MTLPIGGERPIGAMVLAHRIDAPRGFTSLCQRIGRTIAEAAELLVTQASAREQLSAERDVLARLSGTDQLTGVANSRAWEQLQAQSLRGPAEIGYVTNIDLTFGTTLIADGPGGFGFDLAIGGAVPEPSTWAMMLVGFAGLALAGYRRAKAGYPTLALAQASVLA